MTDRQASRTPSRLAKAVRIERDRKGWTSERLADAAGVSHSWVRHFAAGLIQNPGADRLRSLEESLGLRTGELYAASLNIPYDKLVEDLLAGQDGRKAPWDRLLEVQEQVLKELRALSRRVSPSASPVDEEAVTETVARAVRKGVRQGRERGERPPESGAA